MKLQERTYLECPECCQDVYACEYCGASVDITTEMVCIDEERHMHVHCEKEDREAEELEKGTQQ